MAKRKRLVVPNLTDVEKEIGGFAKKPSPELGAMAAPISKVVADSADHAASATEEARLRAAKFEKDAKAHQSALAEGRLVELVAISEITTDNLTRDRTGMSGEGMEELKASIRANGLRMPIEVERLDDDEVDSYGLISGYRRLWAFRELSITEDGGEYDYIPAFVRGGRDSVENYVAMVEENEIREDLAPLERGRIVALGVDEGVFDSVDEAVNTLFASASKAKRSKIRSYALVFQTLGDVLEFPNFYSERQLLTISNAVKAGQGEAIHTALKEAMVTSAEAEFEMIQAVVSPKVSRAKPQETPVSDKRFSFSVKRTRNGYDLRLSGQGVDKALVADLEKWLRDRQNK